MGQTKFVNPIKLNDSEFYTIKVNLTSAQILNLVGTPIVLLPAPGASKYIDIIECSFIYNFVTGAYVSIGTLVIYSTSLGVGTNLCQIQDNNIVQSAATRRKKAAITSPTGAGNNIAVNDSISVSTTGAYTVGAGNLDIYLFYRTVDV
jgi:hypothetical protein